MMGSSAAINELLGLLSRLRAEKDAIRRELESRLAQVDERIAAVQTTLELLPQAERGEGSPPSTDEPRKLASANDWARELNGLTQLKALIKIAERSGGTVRVPEAKRIFIASGMAKGKQKNINPHIYHILSASEQFELIAPGTFKLTDPPSAGDSETAYLQPA
jgi:hypothetical protein